MSGPRIRIPVRLVVVDIVGAILAAIGFYGFIEPNAATTLPFLGISGAPLALLVIGVGMMGYAIVALIQRLAASARSSRE